MRCAAVSTSGTSGRASGRGRKAVTGSCSARAPSRFAELRPSLGEAATGFGQMLWEHLHVCEDGHEVRVTGPPGDHVEMDVIDYACAGDPAQVPAEVVALRPVDLGQRTDPMRREPMDLERLLVRKLAELADVPVGGDHQVPGRVRESVQQHEGVRATVHDELLLVVAGRRVAEDAAGLLVRLLDVLEPPGRPELLGHAGEPTVGSFEPLKSCT